MLVIENDWIEYEPTVARRPAVRGGAACAARFPVASVRPAPLLRAVPPLVAEVGGVVRAPRRRLRLTRRGRLVLVVLPALGLLSGALVTSTARVAEAAPVPVPAVRVVATSVLGR